MEKYVKAQRGWIKIVTKEQAKERRKQMRLKILIDYKFNDNMIAEDCLAKLDKVKYESTNVK